MAFESAFATKAGLAGAIMEEFEALDDFDSLEEQVRELKASTPSESGCLAHLRQQGITGPMAEAAVEAVFNEARDAARQRHEADYEPEDRGQRDLRKVRSVLQTTLVSTGGLVLAVIIGTPGVVVALKFLKSSWTKLYD